MEKTIDIKQMVLTLVSALDTLNPILKNHHRRVAVLSYAIGKEMALDEAALAELVIAASIHDIGASSVADEEALTLLDVEDPEPHEALGALMLSDFELFDKLRNILEHHHVNFSEAGSAEESGIPIEAYIIHLADRVDILLKPHMIAYSQKNDARAVIKSLSGDVFDPRVYEAFERIAGREQLWFDVDMLSMESLYRNITYEHMIVRENHELVEGVAVTLSRIVDFRSRFSVANSAKVALAADRIAEAMGFEADRCFDVKIAGYLHDLGMMAVPFEVLNKEDRLTAKELNLIKMHPLYSKRILSEIKGFETIAAWVGAHHERLGKTGYPGEKSAEACDAEVAVLIAADVFSALSGERPYRQSYSYAQVMDMIKNEYLSIIGHEVYGALKRIGKYLYTELGSLENKLLESYQNHTVRPKPIRSTGYHYLKTELYHLIQNDSDLFDFIQEGSLDGMFYWDLENPEHEWMNPKFWRVFGYDPDEKQHLASEWQGMIFEEDLAVAMENFEKHCENPDHPYDQVVRYRHKDGHVIWVRCRGIAIRDREGKPIRLLGAHTDISEQMRLQETLEERNRILEDQKERIEKLNEELKILSSTDYLTGLYNRQTLDSFLDEEKKRVKRGSETFTLMMIDVNYFKTINDTYGHLVGDSVLIDFAKRLNKVFREQDVKARWGGDEFMIILPKTALKHAEILVKRLLASMTSWYIMFNDKKVRYTITVGLAEYVNGEPIHACVNRADQDLYDKKKIR